MSISFSGLASGLDTTSWVESLVQLRQAKVDTLEEQKKAVTLCRETLNNIKSFFTSFRSVIEKVTDAKFGVASMDIFAQKLATSSNTSVLTALANTEAEEATYNINVNQLASNTQAMTGYKYTTTVIHTATATMDTRLTDLGVKTGEIGINVDGFSSRVSIGDNDTISSFIGKLKNVGVDANYNENSGIFSVNLNRNNIDDTISNTGIVDILHLTKTGGYESSFLEITNVETIVSAATGATKLSELGAIKAGNIQVKANDNTYTFAINGNTTLNDLINNLRSKGIEAELTSEGVFTIKDAEIVDSGGTGIIDALGLEQDVNSKTQTASNLSFQSVTTTVTSATNSTKLKDLEVWAEVGSNPTLTVNGAAVSVNGDMTLDQLMTALRNKGVDISLNNGKLAVSGSELGGSVADTLGISPGSNTGNISQSGVNYVKTTVSVFATGETKLSELGITSSDKLEIHDSAGNAVGSITFSNTTTTDINALFSSLASKGINASINDGRITLSSSDGSYVSGTMADKLGIGVQTVGGTTTTGIGITSSNPLTYSSTVTATGSSKISEFISLPSDGRIYFKGSDGSSKGTYTITANTTFREFTDACNSIGITTTLSNGVLSFSSSSGIYMTDNSGILAQLGISTQTISDSRTTTPITVTSSTPITYTVGADLTLDTKVGDVLSGTYYSLKIIHKNDTATTTFITDQTTFSEIQNWLSSSSDISMTINSNGTISLSSASGEYVNGTFADAVGWGTVTQTGTFGITQTGGVVSVNTSVTATGTSKISDFVDLSLGSYIDFMIDTGSIGYYVVNENTTFNDFISKCSSMGVTATLSDGVLSFSSSGGVYLTESSSNGVLAQLGITTQTVSDSRTTTPITVTSSTPITYTVGADLTLSTKVGDVLSGSSWTLRTSNGYSMTIASSNTFSDVKNFLRDYGNIDMTINSNSTISLYSSGGKYVTGTFADAVGWGTVTITQTVDMTMTGDTVYYTTTVTRTATMSDTLYDIIGSGGYITITNADGTSQWGCPGLTDDINYLNTWLIDKTSGAMSLSMSDGVITVHGDGYYFSGDLATKLGLDKYTTSYTTVGMSQTGLQVTYTVTETATMTSKISDCITNWDSISHEVYVKTSAGDILNTVTIRATDTFNNIFVNFTYHYGIAYSINTSMTNGVLQMECVPNSSSTFKDLSNTNVYFDGDIITALGINHTTTREKVYKTVQKATTGYSITTASGATASASTKMTEFGYQAGDILKPAFFVDEKLTYFTMTISATTTLGEFAQFVKTSGQSVGVDIELNSGRVGCAFSTGSSDNYFYSIYHCDSSGNMYDNGNHVSDFWMGIATLKSSSLVRHIEEKEVDKVVNTSTGKVLEEKVASRMTSSSTLGDIFGTNNLDISYSSNGKTDYLIGIANYSVNDFLNFLVDEGFATSATIDSSGHIKLVADSSCKPLTGITLFIDGAEQSSVSNFLGLEIGEGKSYKQKELYNTSPSNKLNVNQSVQTTITSDTTLSKLGLTGSYYSFTICEDGTENPCGLATSSSTTVGDVINFLNSFIGISASLSNGQITIEGNGNSYLKSTESTFANKLGLHYGSGYTYMTATHVANTDSNVLGASSVETLTSSTKLVDLGFSTGSQNLIDTTAGVQYFTINSSSTMQDLINWFSTKGFSASISNGKLSLNPSGSNYITWMSNNFKNKFALDCGEGITYNATGEVIIGNTNSNKQQTSGSSTITEETTLRSLLLKDSYYYFTIHHNGTNERVTLDAYTDTTIGDFLQKMRDYGLNASLNNGAITISGNENNWLVSMETTFAETLRINQGLGYTYQTGSQTTNTDSNALGGSSVETVRIETKLVDLGFSTGNQELLRTNFGSHTFNITETSTVNDLMVWMKTTLGFDGTNLSLDGKLSIRQNKGSNYITGMSSDFKRIFKLDYGEGITYNSTGELIIGNSNSNKQQNVTTVTASANTTLGELGLSGNATIVTQATNGSKNTIVVNSTTKLSALPEYLNVSGGKLTLSPSSNEFIYSMSSNLADILKLAGSGEGITYKTEGSTSYKNINTKALSTTQTVAANSTTKLNELINAPANPSIVIQTQNKNGMVKNTTINFGKTESLSSVFSALAANGINAYIDGNGKVHLNSDSLADFNLSGSLADYLLGSGSTKTFDITNDLTSKTTTTSTAAATRDTLLSALGVTSGEYNIYKNGVKYTALISSDETLGSFIETLQSFGLQAGLIQNGNSSKLVLIGSGDSYISKSQNPTTASNVVEKLFTSSSPTTTYDYSASELLYATITTKQTATEDTLLSTFDTPWGGSTLKSAGNLALTVNGENKIIKIEENETFGSLVDKLKDAGVQAAFLNGQLYISDAGGVSINAAATTSAIINPNAGIKLASKDTIDGFLASSDSVTQTTTLIEEYTVSASNYADINTKLSTLNISSGTLSVYRNGQKALINVDENWSFSNLQSAISAKFSDVKLNIEDGYLKFYSNTAGVSVEVGSTTDSSNFLAITGMHKDEDGSSISSRELYKVNTDSKVTDAGLFRRGTVKKGDFIVGTAKFTIDENTTIADIISQINNSDEANATAWWDSIGGKLVIKSRTTGAALINIEAGTSNFTDIMGYTASEWNANGTLKFTQLNADTQELGKNAKFTINGTAYTAASNTVTSDISKIKGVTIDLKSISDDTVTLKIEKDKETVAKSLEEVVNAYNELMQNVDEAIASQGKLHDQTTLKILRNQLRMYMTSSDAGADVFRNLDSIGISVSSASASNISTSNQSIINLAFDKDKFLEAYEKDDKAVKALLIGSDSNKGVFTKVEELVDNALKGVTGYFDSADASYEKKIGNFQIKINKQTASIQKYRALLEKKFSAMDMMIANMQQQYSSYLGTSSSLYGLIK